MKTLIIGDIHGCLDELKALIRSAGVTPGKDRIIGIGDLIDRGPDSLGVIRFFRDTPNAESVLGNHEAKFLTGKFSREDLSCRITAAVYSREEIEEIRAYIRTLEPYLRLPGALVVHAGILPGIPLEEQDRNVLIGAGSQGRKYFKAPPYWYDRIEYPVPVVFGHTISSAPIRGKRRNVFGIDLGCCRGGMLCGLLLEERRLVTVRSPVDYAERTKRRHLPSLWKSKLPELDWTEFRRLDREYFDEELSGICMTIMERKYELLSLVEGNLRAIRKKTGNGTTDPDGRAMFPGVVLAALDHGLSEAVLERTYRKPLDFIERWDDMKSEILNAGPVPGAGNGSDNLQAGGME